MFRNKSLLAIAIGGFAIGMTEFVMMGLLPEIAASLQISIPQAGHLISMYALGVVVGAPLIAAFSSRMKPRRVLSALMVFFALAHVASALAPSYVALLIIRFIAGLPHGAFFGVGAVVASRLAPPGKSAAAISVMFFGLTAANVVGVPLGTYLGHAFSWRMVMALISLLGLATLIAVQTYLPEMTASSTSRFRDDLRIFSRSETWFAILITSIGTGGFFAWISYIAPMSRTEAGFTETGITGLLIVAGLGMMVGNTVGGFLADKYPPAKVAVGIFLTISLCLIALSLTASSPFALVVLSFAMGAFAFSLAAPLQLLIMRAAEGSEILGSSLGQACFNMGNSLGAYAGGLPLVFGYGYRNPPLVGAGLALIGGAISVAFVATGVTDIAVKKIK